MGKRFEVRVLNGSYVDASYAGGTRGRESALTDAAFYVAKYRPVQAGAKVSVVETTRAGAFTIIAWTSMFDWKATGGPLVWVLERATGMGAGECDSLGIDWRAERDHRIALGGEW